MFDRLYAEELVRRGMLVLIVQHLTDQPVFPADGPDASRLFQNNAAVLSVLRHLEDDPRVNRDRIALLGHSYGAALAIEAACADWSVVATVALSSSLQPYEYVNHVCPRNLLLLRGSEDRFIGDYQQRILLAKATRGLGDAFGRLYGDVGVGSARLLLRIQGAGHLSILADQSVREEATHWLETALVPGRAADPDTAISIRVARLRGSGHGGVGGKRRRAHLVEEGCTTFAKQPRGCRAVGLNRLQYAAGTSFWADGVLCSRHRGRAMYRDASRPHGSQLCRRGGAYVVRRRRSIPGVPSRGRHRRGTGARTLVSHSAETASRPHIEGAGELCCAYVGSVRLFASPAGRILRSDTDVGTRTCSRHLCAALVCYSRFAGNCRRFPAVRLALVASRCRLAPPPGGDISRACRLHVRECRPIQ